MANTTGGRLGYQSFRKSTSTRFLSRFPLTPLRKDSIKVYNGLLDKDTGHRPKQWDVFALGNRDSDDREDPGWNIPPESIMDGLAKISLDLLNIDPRLSDVGIVLRVKRRIASEWLSWKSTMTFLQFQLEVLYKIDGDAIAIYPGDYVGIASAFEEFTD